MSGYLLMAKQATADTAARDAADAAWMAANDVRDWDALYRGAAVLLEAMAQDREHVILRCSDGRDDGGRVSELDDTADVIRRYQAWAECRR